MKLGGAQASFSQELLLWGTDEVLGWLVGSMNLLKRKLIFPITLCMLFSGGWRLGRFGIPFINFSKGSEVHEKLKPLICR